MPLPALFIAHGHPMNALDDNPYTQSWQQLATGIRPGAVLCISAHWETNGICLTADAMPPTVHDFHGFPQTLYEAQYPCPGAPALAKHIADSLPDAQLVSGRGLDHGCWCVMAKLFPNADIPVIQMSLALNRPAAWHFQIGQLLRPWRERLFIIGSGNIVHNIQRWMREPDSMEWAIQFDQWAKCTLDTGELFSLTQYHQAPFADDAVPTPEHYLPLLYAAATHQADEPIQQTRFPADTLANACMRSVRFGAL